MKGHTSHAQASPTSGTEDGHDVNAGNAPDLTVCYDGGCPLCRREIAGYRQVDGAASFARLRSTLPRTRRLGRLAGTPLALAVLEPACRVFLEVRPSWRRARS